MANLTVRLDDIEAVITAQTDRIIAALNDQQAAIVNELLAVNGRIFDQTPLLQAQLGVASDSGAALDLIASRVGYNTGSGIVGVAELVNANEQQLGAIAANTSSSLGLLNTIELGNQQRNRLLERLLDCGCNNGEPTPVPKECEGDYRRATIQRKSANDGIDSWFSVRRGSQSVATPWPSWVSAISLENARTGFSTSTTTPGLFDLWAVNVPGFFKLEPNEYMCIENVGTQPMILLQVVDSGEGSTGLQQEEVQPFASTGVSGDTGTGVVWWAVVSNVSSNSPDGFKPVFFKQTTVSPGG